MILARPARLVFVCLVLLGSALAVASPTGPTTPGLDGVHGTS